jgi:hypothetical protein
VGKPFGWDRQQQRFCGQASLDDTRLAGTIHLLQQAGDELFLVEELCPSCFT